MDILNGMSHDEAKNELLIRTRNAQTALLEIQKFCQNMNPAFAWSINPALVRAQSAIKNIERVARQTIAEESDTLI